MSPAGGDPTALRVVVLTTRLSGAYGAKLLTDLGADVVVWERPGGEARRADGLDGDLWAYLHTSQRSITGDPAPWVATADVVLLSDPAPPALDPGLLAALRRPRPEGGPRVVVEVSPLGHGGPDDARNAMGWTDDLLQARSGALSGHGHPDTAPLVVGGRLGEHVAGAFVALAALTAWRRAGRTGVPEHVDVSEMEAVQLTMLTVPTLMTRFPGGGGQTRRFVMIPGNEPTADGEYVGITTITVAQWKALLGAMGRGDLADDKELHTMLGRFMRRAETQQVLNDWTTAHTAAEIDAACTEARVPVSIVGNGRVLTEHPHLRERGVFVPQPGESWSRPRAPFRFHGVADRALHPAPRVGEHDVDLPWSPRDTSTTATMGTMGTMGTTATAPDGAVPLPFAGVRVLDFTAFWAGPFSTAWLAAFGADVIKVESAQRPDGIRFSALARPHEHPQFYEVSALFHAANLNKRGLTLDLTTDAGRAVAERLIASADVIVENFTPRVMEGFGFDADAVRTINPSAVYVRLPAFGLSGPWRERPGFAQTMEQLTGMAWVTGYDGGPPIIPGGVVDPAVGTHAAVAIVAALDRRDRTGAGGLVEVPMVEVAVAMTAEQVIRWTSRGELSPRRGSGGVYRCAGPDAWVVVDTASDPVPAGDRAAWCATRSPAEAEAELQAEGVPAAAMRPGHLALDDPQLRARRFFEPLEHPVAGAHEFPTWPVRFAAGPERVWHHPAPLLGQHTTEVLHEAGLDDEAIAALAAAGVTGTRPLM